MAFIPKPQEIYKHFKGKLYQIITLAEDTETGETLVIYQALYGEFKVYARELTMFTSKVDRQKYPDSTQEYRFERQGAVHEDSGECQPETEGNAMGEAKPETVAKGAGEAKPEPGAKGAGEVKPETSEKASVDAELDPQLVAFLDAKTYEEKLSIMAAVHPRITQDMITTMAIACDVEVAEGDLEKRYSQLRNCLLMLEKYECNRLR